MLDVSLQTNPSHSFVGPNLQADDMTHVHLNCWKKEAVGVRTVPEFSEKNCYRNGVDTQ